MSFFYFVNRYRTLCHVVGVVRDEDGKVTDVRTNSLYAPLKSPDVTLEELNERFPNHVFIEHESNETSIVSPASQVKAVWNGVDGYMLLEDAISNPDYNADENGLYTQTETHKPFDVLKMGRVDPDSELYPEGSSDWDLVLIIDGWYYGMK